LLHLWISIARNFHDAPVVIRTCIVTLPRPSFMHFVQSGSFGVQLIKSFLNHRSKDLILSSSLNCNICSGIKDLIFSRISGSWYCSLILLYSKKKAWRYLWKKAYVYDWNGRFRYNIRIMCFSSRTCNVDHYTGVSRNCSGSNVSTNTFHNLK
jgi:hypothetical protein